LQRENHAPPNERARVASTLATVSSDDSEAVFIARLVARDETAFNELVVVYERRVFALTLRMLGRRAEAEEITQDVFVQVFKSIDSFRGESKLSTWIFRVAVNLCKNKMKYHARRGGRQEDLDSLGDHTSLGAAEGVSAGAVARPDEAVEGQQMVGAVRAAIAELDPEFRQLVILRDVEDLAYEEIAEVSGLPIGTVKSRIHRGRAQLKEKVERRIAAVHKKGTKA
jgi:RNA polymerase sigma-70 factor, ECF subfamily